MKDNNNLDGAHTSNVWASISIGGHKNGDCLYNYSVNSWARSWLIF